MIARLRLTFYKLTRGLQLDRKKLRAVIVIGFGLLASPAEKTKSATAQGAATELWQSEIVCLLVAAHAAGRATFPSMPACCRFSS
jgi:hypothetical protein